MTLKAVGFDIDGTLYPDRQAHLRSIPFFLKYMRTVLAFARTRSRMRSEEAMARMSGNPDDVEAAIFADELGLEVEKAREIRDRVIYSEWERIFRKVRPFPLVRESLLRLKSAGLRLAALSDFPVGRKLEYFGLENLFDVVMGYPDSLRLKPRPEPFLEMARRLDVKPENILYVGNKLDYDVFGARNAGLYGALIGVPGRKAPSNITFYRDYTQLADDILSEVAP